MFKGRGSHISRQSAHEGGKVVIPMHRPLLPLRKYSWYSFVLQAESTSGPQCGRKDCVNEKFQRYHRESNPRPSGLQRSTSRNCATACPMQWLLTYLLTPWSRVLLEKLTGSAASQEIPRIFGTRRFITVFTSARQQSLS